MQESSVYQHLVETAPEERYQEGKVPRISDGSTDGNGDVIIGYLVRK